MGGLRRFVPAGIKIVNRSINAAFLPLSHRRPQSTEVFTASTHLDQAEADPLFGQVGVIGHIWLRLHHRFILINGLLITDCK